MPIDVLMPKLSDTMEEGKILRWLKQPGDRVAVGDVLAEVETDKANMELEAFDDGTLAELRTPEGARRSPSRRSQRRRRRSPHRGPRPPPARRARRNPRGSRAGRRRCGAPSRSLRSRRRPASASRRSRAGSRTSTAST